MREARKNPPEGFEWLSVLPAQACQQVLKQYQAAWKRCYAGLARPPRFTSRRRARPAVCSAGAWAERGPFEPPVGFPAGCRRGTTSQRCHVCGFVDGVSRPDQATFLCTSCGWSGNADTNASLNIRAAGLSSMGVEISGLPGTVKRQPPGKAA
ncbi:zinc ribbon domain-containing protein [Candidatus Frankia alpina]|uniref:zinc ribbon domain-containing protein n=1 Tax=Candidatus Frankia alpina TaxID=2699483 RepID=UPI003AF71DDD